MNPVSSFPRLCACHSLPLRPALLPSASIQSFTPLPRASPSLRPRYLSIVPKTRSTAPPPPKSTPPSPSTSSTPASSPLDPPSTTSPTTTPFKLGTITRTGTMQRTIQLTTPHRSYNPNNQTHRTRPVRVLAHDPFPAGALLEGDVVEYSAWDAREQREQEAQRRELQDRLVREGKIRLKTRRGRVRTGKGVGIKVRSVGFVVRRVVTPFGRGIEERGIVV